MAERGKRGRIKLQKGYWGRNKLQRGKQGGEGRERLGREAGGG